MTLELPELSLGARTNDRPKGAVGEAARPFNLLRWYSLASLVTVCAVAIGVGLVQSRFLRAGSIDSDAALSAQFIASVLMTEDRHAALPEGVELVHLLDPGRRAEHAAASGNNYQAVVGEFLDHLRYLPDALLISMYTPQGEIIWSTNPELIGRRIEGNDELEEAFRSREMVAIGHMETAHEAQEQRFIIEPGDFFIENYIPLLDRAGTAVVVVEIYKEPTSVRAAIERANWMVALTVVIGALGAYLVLFGIVRRGAHAIEAQHCRIVETESMSLVGEMSQAIAHGLRSPLAAIRTSAELAIDKPPERAQKNLRDIISETDRLSSLIGNLLAFAGPMSDQKDPVDILKVVDDTLVGCGKQLAHARIRVNWVLPEEPRPLVDGHAALFAQALSSIISNAIEAMPEGGTLRVHHEVLPAGNALELIIVDSGIGMTPEQLGDAMRPFYTSKRKGLGVGLPIAHRILDRFGGSIQIESVKDGGTHVHLFFSMSE